MKFARGCAAGLVLALACSTAMAEAPVAAAFLERLAGEWRGAGEVSGMAADMRMRWEQALDGKFHRLAMENLMTAQDGKTWHFKAEAFYRVHKDGSIAGHWFDSRGISLPLAGRAEGDVMTIDWGNETSAERGRSTYRLAADALEVTDEVYGKDGTLTAFGRTRLSRP
jgi:hypothetical protein